MELTQVTAARSNKSRTLAFENRKNVARVALSPDATVLISIDEGMLVPWYHAIGSPKLTCCARQMAARCSSTSSARLSCTTSTSRSPSGTSSSRQMESNYILKTFPQTLSSPCVFPGSSPPLMARRSKFGRRPRTSPASLLLSTSTASTRDTTTMCSRSRGAQTLSERSAASLATPRR